MATFIEQIAPLIQKYAPQYGIKVVSPIISQAILESASGTSDKVYKNGEWRHNYFGLKFRNNRCAISNEYFEETTAEQNADGSYTQIVSKFCKFKSMEDGVIGYFQWTNISNYANLKGVTDPQTYLQNIKLDKYATSINYVSNLMAVIEKYNLTIYDSMNAPVTEDVVENTTTDIADMVINAKYNGGTRTHSIDRITPHCVVGQMTAKSLGNYFANIDRTASCNYGIGTEGKVVRCVDESKRSYCSSNAVNDQRAITIECASDSVAPYAFNTMVYNKLIDLCENVCRRYGKTKLLWLGDKDKTLAYTPKSDEMVLTVHRWFAKKSCPGDWMMNHMSDLATQVTYRLGNQSADVTPQKVDTDSFLIKVKVPSLNIRSGAGTQYKVVKAITDYGIYTIVETNEKGNWGKLKSGAGWINISSRYCTKL